MPGVSCHALPLHVQPGASLCAAYFNHLRLPSAVRQDAIYDSVARDFGNAPEAWELRAARHVLALPAGAPTAARLAACRAAVGVLEQGLRAAPSPAMVAALLRFLQQQAAELDVAAGTAAAPPAGEARNVAEAAGWLRLRTQEAFEEAEADALLTEELRLQSCAFLLHHGEAHAALGAARAGCAALPQSAALWQQRLVMEAVLAADQLAEGGIDAAPAADQQQQGGSSDSDSEDEVEGLHRGGRGGALPGTAAADTRLSSAATRRRLEALALQALRAVPAADAVPLWLAAISVLAGGGCSLRGLSQLLVEAALRQSKGPVEVGGRLAVVRRQTKGSGGATLWQRQAGRVPPSTV